MSESKSKAPIYIAVGATVVVGAALLFNYISGKATSSNSLCFEEIDALGAPQKDPNGLLSFAYYKDVFLIISKHAKSKFSEEKKELIAKRR